VRVYERGVGRTKVGTSGSMTASARQIKGRGGNARARAPTRTSDGMRFCATGEDSMRSPRKPMAKLRAWRT
jgi:diaminopimelate epimerase